MPDLTPAQLQRLTAARFDGPQALFTEAVRLLSERPALPDDLDGLVARMRDGCNLQQRDGERAARAIEALAANRAIARAERAEAALAVAEEALQWVKENPHAHREAVFSALAKIAALKGGEA